MILGGLQKLTLLDYPGKIAATIFTFGCNFRCGFCHNPELVHAERRVVQNELKEEAVLNFLQERQGFLEGVVITGGEPTLHKDLPRFLQKIRELGFSIKIDTNGTNNQMLAELLNKKLVNFWAMDIKNTFAKYTATVEREIELEEIKKNIELIKNSGLDYEFRTTVVEGLHSAEDILEMAKMISGAKKYVLQKFISRQSLVNPKYIGQKSFSDEICKI